ncbi:uncharacterized protein LOC101889981 [Musca domestica]|uniref:Uncharacterized protein LOC101889981 n=1 Tax=Musca domestica TaxID=7370 RepID=A0A1I8N1F6_MUSDO|nr:uncharacterized protein LOC101889981 [Musca domestica]
MQKVNFLFKIMEIILGLICLGYHTSGFLNVDFVQTHYTYCCIFGGFTLMAMYGCLAICLQESESVHPWWEGGINLLAAVCFIAVSVDSMFHAEKDFYLTYLISRQDEHDEKEEPHPFFKYSKAQSIAALYCGCLFLLHSIIAFDFALHQQRRNENDVTMDDANSDNSEDSKIELYVCGKAVHKRLEKYDWFKKLN